MLVVICLLHVVICNGRREYSCQQQGRVALGYVCSIGVYTVYEYGWVCLGLPVVWGRGGCFIFVGGQISA